MDVDFIPLKVPCDKGHQVYMSGLRWDGIQEELEEELRKVFGSFGPIHRVTAKKESLHLAGQEGNDLWYGYVVFFSSFDTESVLQHSGRIVIGNNIVQVRKKKGHRDSLDCALPLHKSQELLMHYFGFNCWNSEIVHLERDSDEELTDVVRFVCLVRVRMPKESLSSEGLGLGEAPLNTASPQGLGSTISKARRMSFQSAMRAAFAKFIIIRLRNGKVTVEVDTTQTDLQIYDPAWDNIAVKVNNIDYDPEEEDDSDDDYALFEDIDEDELDALLDMTVDKE